MGTDKNPYFDGHKLVASSLCFQKLLPRKASGRQNDRKRGSIQLSSQRTRYASDVAYAGFEPQALNLGC
ncbi:unnamed protein product [Peniophora sp. CBMAI 1063]|nr:unnamed protein product [Peniophora sp. CBMAI 1063]